MANKVAAIIDPLHHDPGLFILLGLTAADYYIFENNPSNITSELYERHNTTGPIMIRHQDIPTRVSDHQYDYLFIVFPLYCYLCKGIPPEEKQYIDTIVDLIRGNSFRKIVFFDNMDYDYDPAAAFARIAPGITKNILFAKRNYSRDTEYTSTVFPFPYVMFGRTCNIDVAHTAAKRVLGVACGAKSTKLKRLFFAGDIFHHEDIDYGIVRSRCEIFHKLCDLPWFVYSQYRIPHNEFMFELERSMFCLDLLGVGDPNKRTFEIFASGSLRIAQRSSLVWGDFQFDEETVFDNEIDLNEKINALMTDNELYERCLNRQNEIVARHMTMDAVREYLFRMIASTSS